MRSLSGEADNQSRLFKLAVDRLTSGVLMLERNRITIANPAALHLLHLEETHIGQALHIDGPSGPLMERLNEVCQGFEPVKFDYQLVVQGEEMPRVLQITALLVESQHFLVEIDDVSSTRNAESRWRQAIILAVHTLKTPLAVMSAGLSSLITYYERYSDEDRRELIEEMSQQVREMTATIQNTLKDFKRP